MRRLVVRSISWRKNAIVTVWPGAQSAKRLPTVEESTRWWLTATISSRKVSPARHAASPELHS